MVLSGIFILDMKGKVLISRNYRGDIENTVVDKFIGLVMDKEEDGSLTPLVTTDECTFAFIKRNNLYVVATTKKNSNIAMIFVLLHKICAVRIFTNLLTLFSSFYFFIKVITEASGHWEISKVPLGFVHQVTGSESP
jgi:hypothetical protein